jgi:hypothetical protein
MIFFSFKKIISFCKIHAFNICTHIALCIFISLVLTLFSESTVRTHRIHIIHIFFPIFKNYVQFFVFDNLFSYEKL